MKPSPLMEKNSLKKKREKLERFISPLLRCVQCRSEKLQLFDQEIRCQNCREIYPLFQETPIMLPQPDQAFDYSPSEIVTREYDQHWYDVMGYANGGPILDMGSGNNPEVIDNLVKFDMFALPNVEIVGDAEILPFKCDSFNVIFSSAVFEHLRDPFLVSKNLHEILRVHGQIYIEAGFLAPMHAYPNHFFNMTKPGIEELFSHFKKLDSGTLPHMFPSFTLMWIVNAWLNKQTPEQREDFLNATVRDIQTEYQKNIFSRRWMENFSKEDQEELACGVFFLGRKEFSDSKNSSIPVESKPPTFKEPASLAPADRSPRHSNLTRTEKVMKLVNQKGLGLEIGPSFHPIAPKKLGYNVHTLDLCSAEELRWKYRDDGVDLSEIEEVDFIWKGESLPDLVGKKECYDWIIASHVLEHVPDFITFLVDCDKLLKPDGVLSLIIPDKRFCFDYFQNTSSTGEILDAFLEKRTRPSPGKVFDFCSRAAKSNNQITWEPGSVTNFKFVHTLSLAKKNWKLAQKTSSFFDVHNWRFTPASFRLVLRDLQTLNLIGLTIQLDYDTAGYEFFVTLVKKRWSSHVKSSERMELLKKIRETEI